MPVLAGTSALAARFENGDDGGSEGEGLNPPTGKSLKETQGQTCAQDGM